MFGKENHYGSLSEVLPKHYNFVFENYGSDEILDRIDLKSLNMICDSSRCVSGTSSPCASCFHTKYGDLICNLNAFEVTGKCYSYPSIITSLHTISTLENTVGKGENAGNQYFVLYPQCFLLYQRNSHFSNV